MSTPPLAQIRRLIAEGYTYGQIADATGLTTGQVAGLIHRHLKAEWAERPNPQSFRAWIGRRPVGGAA